MNKPAIATLLLLILISSTYQKCGHDIIMKKYGSQLTANFGYGHDANHPDPLNPKNRVLQTSTTSKPIRIRMDYATQSDGFIASNSQFNNHYAISKRIFTSVINFLTAAVTVNTPATYSFSAGSCSGNAYAAIASTPNDLSIIVIA